ncbi:MAG: OmpA family protein [Rhodocyclaceae bacterium]|nr:OmpA family protein [Rhodocyclaceae bacterium]
MQDEDDDLRIVLGALFGILALVIGLVIGLGVYQLNRATAGAPAVAAQAEPVAAAEVEVSFTDIAPQGEPQLKLYFEVGQSALSEGAKTDLSALAGIVSQMGAGEAVVLISGYHDESGTAEVNAEIAKQRAVNVRNALLGHGIAPATVLLRKPEVTLGGDDPAEARRVEVRVQ